MSIFDEILNSNDDTSSKICSLISGIVTDINDPDNKNRVKVKLSHKVNDKSETSFIPVAMPMVGKDYGMYFMPEIGDEVLVGFEMGDIERAYVIGAIYNDSKKAPATIENGENNLKIIKSKKDNQIVINDKDDELSIKIQTKNGYEVLIDDKNKKIEIKDKDKANMMEIDSGSGKITIKAKSKITLETDESSITLSRSSIDIKANKDIKLDAPTVDINASSSFKVSSSQSVEIKSGGVATFKGATIKLN